MSIEDNDNFYVLNEEDIEKEPDETPLNYAAYRDEDLEDEDVDDIEVEKERKSHPFLLMLNIMINPVEGWKKLRRNKIKAETLQSGCFYPLLAILAASKFVDFFYSVNATLSQVITEGIVVFVSFFFGYFSIPIILSWVLPRDMVEKFEIRFGKEYLLISLSTLALFSIFTELLPMIWPILIFLPIWTLYIMYKGTRFFHFQQNQEMRFFILAGASVIGVPLLIDWVLTTILPY